VVRLCSDSSPAANCDFEFDQSGNPVGFALTGGEMPLVIQVSRGLSMMQMMALTEMLHLTISMPFLMLINQLMPIILIWFCKIILGKEL
jgi:hypothetical protein